MDINNTPLIPSSIWIEGLIEDIEFSKEVCRNINPCWGIPLDRLYQILSVHIPEFKNYFENGQSTNTRNNTPELASVSTATIQ